MAILGYLLLALLGPLAFAGVLALVRRRPTWCKRLAAVGLGLVLLRALFHIRPDIEYLLLPWSWYLWVQGWWIFPVGLAFFAATLPTLPAGWKRLLIQTFAVLLWGSSLLATSWLIHQPVLGEDASPNTSHQLRQSTPWTCAPTACAMLLSYWGIPTTEQEMCRLCLTRGGADTAYVPGTGMVGPGTSYFNIYRGLCLKIQGHPLRVRIVRLDAPTMATLGVPCIAGDFHARVVYGTPQQVVVHDPLGGRPAAATLTFVSNELAGTAVVIESTDGTAPLPPAATGSALMR